MRRRSSLSEESSKYYEPKPTRSAPVTPCDSDTSTLTWSETYETFRMRRSDKASYEASTEGMWWWRRPLGVRRTTCRRCGASSSTRPLQMTPCIPPDDYYDDQRPVTSADRPLNFFRQLFL